jgi:CRP-like cAMP-binding protein
MMYEQDIEQMEVFQGLNTNQLNWIKPWMELCHFPDETLIFEQGQTANALYILLEGEVFIEYKPYDGPLLTVARILPGGVFGWSAALGRKQYTSAAVAHANSSAYCISRQNLHKICEQDPETGGILIDRLASVIAERLRNTHSEILSILSEGMDLNNSGKRNAENE